MQRPLLFFATLLLAALPGPRVGAATPDDFAMVVERYRSLLRSDDAPDPQPGDDAREAPRWVAALAADGRWPDIDYASHTGGAWPALAHLRRVRTLARETANPRSKLSHDAAAEQVILRALAHWTGHRYQNPNWWQNQIGTPQVMRDIIVLLGTRLSGAARVAAMQVLHQFKLMEPGFGANTVWSAELALTAAMLERDASVAAQASGLIAGEIVSGGTQGIQDDYSFLQHGARLQQFHYGSSFFRDTVRLAWLLRGTAWAFPPEKAGLLADFALHGSRWMSRGPVTVPGTLDRAVSRPGALAGADLSPQMRLLAELLPERAGELARAGRKSGAPTGFRGFPRADFAAYHTAKASFFLKTISTRTEVTETLLRENRKGGRLNWGDHYILTDTSNYVDLPPVWDWSVLPGITASAEIDSVQRQPLSGSVSDGRSGAVALDYRVGRDGRTTLAARKFWAMHGGVMIGLVGDLTVTEPGGPVRTALDQRRLTGIVTVADAQGVRQFSGGETELSEVRWIHHDGLLYVPLGGEPLTLKAAPVTGSWQAINRNYSAAPVTESIFLPVIEHGRQPRGVASGFAIAVCKTPGAAKELASRLPWRVVCNDAGAQAVEWTDGTVLAVFYEAGEVTLASGRRLGVDTACLLMLYKAGLWASDPTHQGRKINLTVAGRPLTETCPADGKAVGPITL